MKTLVRSGLVLVAALSSLTACTGISEVKKARIEGTEFGHYLARGYKDLALHEGNVRHDNRAAAIFSEKALKAQENLFVEPSLVEEYNVPRAHMEEIRQARSELVSALFSMKTPGNYAELATAQVKFDCWLESLEEKNSDEMIASCREDFQLAMDRLNDGDIDDQAFMVFFPLGSSEPYADSGEVLETVAMSMKEDSGLKAVLTGNADASGPKALNEKISLQRAEEIRDILVGLGVPGDRVEMHPVGESNLLVRTPDGAKEPKNRRVDILVTKR